ncbi:MAG: 16S rRNA (uracil(1498)-N(3))-methyltransferase [Verrucomicrobiales bacterium]|nr:16S rRNA (uracil(1498)-N(3))-methyltransferase [Verrucomicrobiales bacterium]
MPKHRFYLKPEDWGADSLELRDDEAHHCRDVMRCGVGEVISVFDGNGREITATIVGVTKKAVSLEAGEEISTTPLPARITLGQAIPKGKNMDLIIQKATELGAARVVPLLTTNTVVQLNEREKVKKQEKWQRVAIEACKQSGQNWMPEVAIPQSIGDFVAEASDSLRIVAAIASHSLPLKEIIQNWDRENEARPETASLLIGPEGDFTTPEVEAATSAGFLPMSLGPIILRSETAAIYGVSVLAYELMGR